MHEYHIVGELMKKKTGGMTVEQMASNGGKARARKLSRGQRQAIASLGGKARAARKNGDKQQ